MNNVKNTSWKRNCPVCNKIKTFKTKWGYDCAVIRNSLCSSCSMKGSRNPNLGLKRSNDTKRKISESQMGEKNHMYGKHPSTETRMML